MISRTYYYSTTQEFVDNLHIGDELTDIWLPKDKKFLNQLGIQDEILVTVSANDSDIIKENKGFIKAAKCTVTAIDTMTNSIMDFVIKETKSDISNNSRNLLDWAFERGFKSTLIFCFDKYPSTRVHIERLLTQHANKGTYASLSMFLIKRYNYDISKDRYRLFELAAMGKNAALTEMLLEECDAKIPANVYNAYKAYGTKHFQYMWNILKKYSDRVLLS